MILFMTWLALGVLGVSMYTVYSEIQDPGKEWDSGDYEAVIMFMLFGIMLVPICIIICGPIWIIKSYMKAKRNNSGEV